ncbi:hypothetical protein [Methylosinus sp. PW1]|uniref:hypothetical protein n=1 Tax=Methylosinus sp. PW1 TaxID=107636 RepID=UPI0005603102|nr:hypothetical protein [Methylosinus sp. PW1]
MPSLRTPLRPNGVVMFGSGTRDVARIEHRGALDLDNAESIAIADEAELRRLIIGRFKRSRLHRHSRRRRIA